MPGAGLEPARGFAGGRYHFTSREAQAALGVSAAAAKLALSRSHRDKSWKLHVNAKVEAEM